MRLMNVLAGTEEKTYSDADGRRKTLVELTAGMKKDAAGLDESSARSEEEIGRLRRSVEETEKEAAAIRSGREETSALRGEDELSAAETGEKANEERIRLAELNRDRKRIRGNVDLIRSWANAMTDILDKAEQSDAFEGAVTVE